MRRRASCALGVLCAVFLVSCSSSSPEAKPPVVVTITIRVDAQNSVDDGAGGCREDDTELMKLGVDNSDTLVKEGNPVTFFYGPKDESDDDGPNQIDVDGAKSIDLSALPAGKRSGADCIFRMRTPKVPQSEACYTIAAGAPIPYPCAGPGELPSLEWTAG